MLERIKASLPSLAPAEQRVGKLVLADPRAFANLPVTELADRAHVSKPTVVRFCRSMGYDGLSDFKLKLAGSVSEGVPFIHRSVDADDKTSDVAVKVIDNTVAAFLKYRNDASSFALEHAAQALAEAGLPDLGWYDLLWTLYRAPGRRLRVNEVAREVVLSPTARGRSPERRPRPGSGRRACG